MNAALDRIEAVLDKPELSDNGKQHIPAQAQPGHHREPSTGQKDQIQIAEHSTHKPKKAHRSVPTQ